MTPPPRTTPASSGRRLPPLLALALLVGAWWYAAWLPIRSDRLAGDIFNHRAPVAAFDNVPLTPGPARVAAQRLLAEDTPDFARIDALFAHSIALRPLYAPYRLDRAEAALNAGDTAAAEDYLATATRLWPTRPVLLWKAAMLYTRLGDNAAALATLRDYIRGEPHGYRRALAVARRLTPNPASALQAVLPAHLPEPERVSRDDILSRILGDAHGADDRALGRAAWQALSPERRRDPETARRHVEWLARAGEVREAVAVWAGFRDLDTLPALENGGFEADLRGGLGWRRYDGEGFAITRDPQAAQAGAASLRVTFAGTKNVNFHHLRQYLPVEPGRRYVLEYDWRAAGLSTRSGPYLEIHAPDAGRLAAGEGRWGDWDWTREQLAFTAPARGALVEVRLRRNPTDALDKLIAGRLWLDTLTLDAVPAGEGGD